MGIDSSRGNPAFFTDTHAAAAWDFGAAAWDQFLESGADYYRHEVHGPALLGAAEPLGGRVVLDIGCGQGYFSRLMATRGARVIAVDVSREPIALAASREQREPLGIEPFREWERDASGRKRCLKQERYFDSGLATCRWNMPGMAYHWSTPYWRRTFTEWMAVLTGHGFQLIALSEPRPSPEQVAANPRLEDCYRMPYFLILNVQKPPLG